MKRSIPLGLALALLSGSCTSRAENAAKAPSEPPFNYVWAKGYHVLPGTHNNESGYFSLVEGKVGKLYVGTAKYGENSFLVELDPKTGKQQIVIDTNKVTGTNGRGYAAQSKIHTKNFVGPSGKVYVGSKEGYPSGPEKKANDVSPYPGGYVMTYDPATGKAENLGMPYPGQGINDVVADEGRGLIYVITCEDQYWMVYDTNAAVKRFRWLGPELFPYASTIVDAKGRANSITKDYKMARWDPATNALTEQPIQIDGASLEIKGDRGGWIPSWHVADDGKTAYLIRMSYSELYKLDLTGDIDKPVKGTMVGKLVDYPDSDCRSGLGVGPDGKVYAVVAVKNREQWGKNYQYNHLTSYDPGTGKFQDLGAIVMRDKNFFDFSPTVGPDGKTTPKPFSHGFETMPDGNMAAQYQHLGSIVARDGSVYVLFLYPYTVAHIEPQQIVAAAKKSSARSAALAPAAKG